MIRIIAGKYKSRMLLTPPNNDVTRPTKDMVRGAIFSAIGDRIVRAKTLDLFAGSGAFSFEALSRGASFALINDLDKKAVEVIKENAKNLQETPLIYNFDYHKCLQSLNDTFDIVFLDPPYAMDIYDEVINYLIDNSKVSDDAIFVLESNKDLDIDTTKYKKVKKYKYGYTLVCIIWR